MAAYPIYPVIRGVGAFAMATATTLNLVYQIQTVGLGPLELVLVGAVAGIGASVVSAERATLLARPYRPDGRSVR